MVFTRALTFRAKLTLIFFLLVLSLSVIFVLFATRIYKNEEKSAVELRATSLTSLLSESVTNPLYDLRFDQLKLILRNVREQPQVLYAYAYDVNGKILADGTEENRYFNTILDDSFHSLAVRAKKVLLQYKHKDMLGPGNMLDAAQPTFLPNGQKLGGVRIGFSLLSVQQKVTQAQRYILLLGMIIALGGCVLSIHLGKRLVRPIEDLVRGTQLVGSGNLDVQIAVSARDELGTLARSFNQMAVSLKQSDATLQHYAEELEAKVEARTRELQEANQRLQRQQIQLEIASRHKSQFLANMSHELRTPLNAILGYTELVLDNIYGEAPEKIRGVLQRVQHSGRHLLGLINEVLDLSKIEAGQLTLSVNDYSMEDVVQTVATAVESLVAEKKLALKVTVPPSLPLGRGDERRITQVLLNLVGNAIKFTDVGEVRVHATVADSEFVVSVSDTGPGISTADQQRIFEEFQQVDSSSTRQQGGTGLGLSIAKKIIELHGGRMWVESSLGKGSTFGFKLPLRVERRTESS